MLLNRLRIRVLAVATLAAGLAAIPVAPAAADHTPTPVSVTVAGSLQEELGCPGDWQPDCAVTHLTYEADSDVWSGTFTVPAGTWEYKAPLNDAWDENYGANATFDGANIALDLAADTDVAFYYSHNSHWITDDVNSRIVTAAGSFQAAIGCPGDWQPECMRSWLQDPDGDDVYTFTTTAIPAGSYEAKAAVGRSWDENYGAGGVANGDNIAFTVAAGEAVTFSFDSATNVLTIDTGESPYSDTIEPGDEALVAAPVRPESDESVYFVMTDRFANGDTANDQAGEPGDRLVNGFDPTDKGFHHGGDIAGLQAQLDYIEGLGVGAVWITPPFKNDYIQGPGAEVSSSYHGYWQIDFTQIDPHYGTNAEMQAFIADAHSRGIKVLFDVVLNHTGDLIDYVEGSTPQYRNKTDFPYLDATGAEFDDRAVEGTGTFPDLDPATSFPYTPIVTEATKAPDWLNNPIYYHNRGDSTFAGENSQYGDFFGLDDLFHEHPVVVDGMIDIHNSMIDTFDVDGFRVDTVKHVSDGFWEAWVPAVLDHAAAAGKDDFVMFGEVFGETHQFRSRYSTELEFPGTLDFGFNGNAYRFAANSAATNELSAFFATDDWYTDTDSNAHDLAKFMGNHDIGRLALEVVNLNGGASDDELVARLEIAQALNWLTRGIPVVYYGDEQGFVGDGGDQDARQDMMPSQVATYNDDDLIGTDATTADANFDPTHPLYAAIADLAAVRDAHPALQTGAQVIRSSSGSAGVFAFSRIEPGGAGNEYVVAINNAETEQSATFATDTASSGWTAAAPASAPALTSDGDANLTVTVPPLSWVVYQADSPLTSGASADSFAIAMTAPAEGAEVVGRAEVGADLLDDRYAEVTFAVSVDGGAYEVIGTDENAAYNVYHDVSGYPVGSTVTFKAIAKDAGGNLVSNTVSAVVGEEVEPPPPGGGDAAYAIIHYQRSDGDYGDHTTGDFNDFWGLHLWGDAIDPSEATDWAAPKPFLGEDEYGRFAWVKLAEGASATDINFIVHRGDAKDGTADDRSFDSGANPEIWLKQDDGATYTSQADAQGFITIHYHRDDGDYGDPTSADYNDFWGLHLWGDAIDPAEATEWTAPKPFDGVDDYGAFWNVAVVDTALPVNFIIHRGDAKDPGPDQAMVPAEDASIWIQSGDEVIYGARGAAEDFATIHYHRDDGDYGDPSSVDFNDFWGLHLWVGAAEPNPSWQQPMKPTGFDLFGPYWQVPLVDGAPELAHIIHRGDEKDPGPDQFLTFSVYDHEVWQLENADPDSPYIIPVPGGGGGGGPVGGNIGEQRAHWVDATTIVWDAGDGVSSVHLCGSAAGGMTLSETGLDGADTCLDLTSGDPYPSDIDGRLHLGGLPTWTISGDDADAVAALLTGQVAVVAVDIDGNRTNATGLQLPGVLDDLYATDAELGAVWLPAALPATPPRPELRLWAPTATSVSVHLYNGPTGDPVETVAMTADGGVWTATGEPDWNGRFYLYEVTVYVPSTDAVETNLVTDPYSVSLARNSTRSQIVDLADPALAPAGWSDTAKPPLGSFEEVSVYELHVRDFSIRDESVPSGDRGTFAAFTHDDSDGMAHLSALADAGLTHVHLLPVFDIATIDEDASARTEPDWATLESYPPDSDQQQALISPIRDEDGFNWGYDPFHYTVPEGSYSTDPQGPTRITEFRDMVQSLNGTGLRVVMDVVYNHTNAAGQDPKSVLDRIVPGYYHRLDEAGAVTMSTCCSNTATEHAMMGKLMVDSVVTWAREYKVDGFRFDLMGHHSKANMLAVRAALDELTEADDGVDGSKILIYGEGWNFGEVADDARFVQATQLNLGGTGIATFSDRLRDAVRGGGPFDGGDALVTNQGWANGLWYDPNAAALPESEARNRLLLASDQIRVGLAGNLADYSFTDRTGATVTGSQIDYNGSPAGYTADPQENVVYIAAHDNQTLFDIGQYHHPLSTSTADRARAQNVGNAVVALAQGLSFYHAGQDMLRSKSMDRDSYNSGDWFNRLDFTYQTNNWGAGLPVEDVNGDNWYLIQPRLADPALKPTSDDIEFNAAVTREWLQVRRSTPLFSLASATAVQDAVSFHNTGPDQAPGVIVMSIDDADDLDPEAAGVVVVFNPTTSPVEHTIAGTVGSRAQLHPVLASSVDEVVRTASFDDATGAFTVPARTAAVFVVPEPDVTPPTVTAALELVQQRGPQGVYRVVASCVDTGGVEWADGGVVAEFSAELNGVLVTDGQELFLITRPGQQKVIDTGPQVTIQAPSFELVVTCTDAWGNTTTERITP